MRCEAQDFAPARRGYSQLVDELMATLTIFRGPRPSPEAGMERGRL